MVELKDITEFDEFIKDEEEVLVDFYADWCGPCKMLGMVLEEYSSEHPNKKILRVNSDNFGGLARKYRVVSIPALKVFKKGEIVREKQGFMRKEELEAFLGSEE